jgi:hypothetical protein
LRNPSPSSIQSTGTSTGVAIELRKSSPSASATKIAGKLAAIVFSR